MDPTVGEDERWMRRALDLAARADFRTGHNPKVGAVVVRQGRVLGEGYHQVSGADHAEVIAIEAARAAGHDVRGATLYVTLEPCTSFPRKRTPACVDLAMTHRIGRAVIAMEDPNPYVAGSSIARMRAQGIEVTVGVHEQRARLLNAPYVKWAVHGQPFVTACWDHGASWAGTGMAPDRASAPRTRIQRMRGEADAILVDVDLVHREDPVLTRGDVPGKDPVRVVVDADGRLPVTSRLVRSAQSSTVLVLTSARAAGEWQQAMNDRGVEVVPLDHGNGEMDGRNGRDGRLHPAACLAALEQRNLRTILLENGNLLANGNTTLAAFLRERLVDRIACAVPAAALPALVHVHVDVHERIEPAGASPKETWLEISGYLPARWLGPAARPAPRMPRPPLTPPAT